MKLITLKQIGRFLLDNPNKKFRMNSGKSCIIAKMVGQSAVFVWIDDQNIPVVFSENDAELLCKHQAIWELAQKYTDKKTGKTLFRHLCKLTKKGESYFN